MLYTFAVVFGDILYKRCLKHPEPELMEKVRAKRLNCFICPSAPSSPPAETPDVYIVERLFSSSLVVVVSTAMPQRMNIYHFKKGTEICNYSYPNNILSVKLNRQVSIPGPWNIIV